MDQSGNGVKEEAPQGAVKVDLLQLVHRQLLIARDAAETGLLLLEATRQGRVSEAEETGRLEKVIQDNAPPPTFMSGAQAEEE